MYAYLVHYKWRLYALAITKRAFPRKLGGWQDERRRGRSAERFGAEGRIGRMYN